MESPGSWPGVGLHFTLQNKNNLQIPTVCSICVSECNQPFVSRWQSASAAPVWPRQSSQIAICSCSASLGPLSLEPQHLQWVPEIRGRQPIQCLRAWHLEGLQLFRVRWALAKKYAAIFKADPQTSNQHNQLSTKVN